MIKLTYLAVLFLGIAMNGSSLGTSSPEKEPFERIPLKFSAQDKDALNRFDVQRTHEKVCYDVKKLKIESQDFFAQIGKNTPKACKKAADLVDRITKQVLHGVNARASSRNRYTDAYVMLRSFVSNTEYDIPRWHTDGYFFKPYEGVQSKVAVVFKGAGTLFCAPTDRVRARFCQHPVTKIGRLPTLEERKKLGDVLNHSRKINAPQWTGIEFRVGDDQEAAIHSEPSMKENRIFLSIVPGSAKDLQERQKFDALNLRTH